MNIEARARAVQALYEADLRGVGPELSDLPAKARRLVEGTLEHLEELDAELAATSRRWRLERMAPVDRAILRMGLYELRYEGTPPGVVISEAVGLAKTYSTERSSEFVNGVLAKLAADR